MLVYEKNNRAVGFATFGPFRTWPAYKYTIEHSVYVNRDTNREYATLVAGIDAANGKSIKLHEKLGFEYSGVIKKAGYKFDQWLDLAFYQLDLKGPAMPVEG